MNTFSLAEHTQVHRAKGNDSTFSTLLPPSQTYALPGLTTVYSLLYIVAVRSLGLFTLTYHWICWGVLNTHLTVFCSLLSPASQMSWSSSHISPYMSAPSILMAASQPPGRRMGLAYATPTPEH